MTSESGSPRDHIFISYRRDDVAGTSGRLYDYLCVAFGGESVFYDVHSISIGKWREKIDAALARSAAFVAVIGPRWTDEKNLLRLHDEQDTLRHELVTALATKKMFLIPTLVEEAEKPDAAKLPKILRPLFEWNIRRISTVGWKDDTRRLISEIANLTGLAVISDFDKALQYLSDARRLILISELLPEQKDAVLQTMDKLMHDLGKAPANDRPALIAAFAALAEGDSVGAENAFQHEYEKQKRAAAHAKARQRPNAAATARKMMAQAARNVGNLALIRDPRKARSFYRRALRVSSDSEPNRLLGTATKITTYQISQRSQASTDPTKKFARRDNALQRSKREGSQGGKFGRGSGFSRKP